MIVDVKAQVLDYRGKPIVDSEDNKMLVGDALFTAADRGGTQQDNSKDKLLRFRLSMRIVAAMDGDGKLSLTSSEAAILMEGVVKLYMPLVVGRISEIVDGDEELAAPDAPAVKEE